MLPYILGAFNSTEFLDESIAYLLTVFTGLMGDGYLIIPISVITGALYIQKKDFAMVGMFMITTGALLGGGTMFVGYGDMAVLYIVFAGLGLATLIVSILFGR